MIFLLFLLPQGFLFFAKMPPLSLDDAEEIRTINGFGAVLSGPTNERGGRMSTNRAARYFKQPQIKQACRWRGEEANTQGAAAGSNHRYSSNVVAGEKGG